MVPSCRRALSGVVAAAALALACDDEPTPREEPGANARPVAAGATALTVQETAMAVTLTATDADGDPLTFNVVTPPSHGSLTGTPPALTYLPAAGYAGSDTFTFTASDAREASDPASVSVTVYPATGPDVPGRVTIDLRMAALLLSRGMVGGASLAISRNGALVLARGYGYADAESKTPFEPGSLSRIASVSKTVTMAAVLHLVEGGVLGLDDRLLDHLPAYATPAPLDARTADITLRQVLGHAAGFPGTGDYNPLQMQATVMADLDLAAPPSCGEVFRWWLGHRSLAYAPGAGHAYSSIGYCALSLVVEEVTEQDYQAYVRETVLAPMGIHAMRFAATHREDRAPGEVTYHSTSRSPSVFPGDPLTVPTPYGSFAVPAYAGAGAWIASAVDLTRFLDGIEGRGRAGFLSPGSMALALTDQWAGFGYGLGIDFLLDAGSGTLWKGHTGWFGTSPEVLALRSDSGWAFALILNSSASSAPTYSNVDAFLDFIPIVRDAIASGLDGATEDLYPSLPSPELGASSAP